MRIDHVIWTTSDLQRAAAELSERHGLVVTGGGRHEGHGTENLIAPLGGGFLEILAVADPAVAEGSPIGRAVTAAGEGLFGWVVAVDDVASVIDRLGSSRLTLTRGTTQMQLAGVTEAMSTPWLPFFIERSSDGPDPGAAGADGGIASIEVGGDAAELSRWLGGAQLPIDVVDEGRRGVRSVTLGSGTVLRADLS